MSPEARAKLMTEKSVLHTKKRSLCHVATQSPMDRGRVLLGSLIQRVGSHKGEKNVQRRMSQDGHVGYQMLLKLKTLLTIFFEPCNP